MGSRAFRPYSANKTKKGSETHEWFLGNGVIKILEI